MGPERVVVRIDTRVLKNDSKTFNKITSPKYVEQTFRIIIDTDASGLHRIHITNVNESFTYKKRESFVFVRWYHSAIAIPAVQQVRGRACEPLPELRSITFADGDQLLRPALSSRIPGRSEEFFRP